MRVNNAVRQAIDDAMGALTLFSADPGTRAQAAEAVFKSHDPAALPAITRALAQEQNAGVKHIMEQARAAVLLASPNSSDADKLAAIPVLRDRGDLEAQSQLDGLGNSKQSPAVAKAATDAVASIARLQQVWALAQGVFYGLSLGSVLLLAAAGLAITFGVMGVINMAHGEMVMLGAYTTYVVQQVMQELRAGAVRRQPVRRDPAVVHRLGRRRHRDRADADPLPLRPPAGNAARHLGPVAGVAAGGALHLRRAQPSTCPRRTG